jgi:two-component system nitrate/nitrite response regulator NarL
LAANRLGQPPVRVVIVDDHKLFAEAVRSALERWGMDVVGLATTAAEAEASIDALRPDVVLLDIGLPDEDGLSLAERLVHRHRNMKVIVVTAMSSPKYVSETMRRGLHGYLTKDTPMAQLADSVRAAVEGRVLISQKLARAAAGGLDPEEQHAALLAKQLTLRERDVLSLLAQGLTGTQIARNLSMSPNTVRTHVQAILSKLQVHSRLEAAAFGVRHGIVNPPRFRL